MSSVRRVPLFGMVVCAFSLPCTVLLCRYPRAVGGHLGCSVSAVMNDVSEDVRVLVFWWDMCACLLGSYLGGKLLWLRVYVGIASVDPDT